MNQTVDSPAAALATWDTGAFPLSLVEHVALHPQFRPAALRLAENMLSLAAKDRRLDSIFKDGGRYLGAVWAVHLGSTVGLTLGGLKALCEETGYISPGRARNLLAFFRYLGYVEAHPAQPRGATSSYSLSTDFLESWTTHLRLSFEAARIIEPGVSVLLESLDDPRVFAALAESHREIIARAVRTTPADAQFAQAFIHRHAGSQIAHAMILASPAGEFPSPEPFAFSQAATARRFGVSRTHVRRLLEGAAGQQILEMGAHGTLRLLTRGRGYVAYFYASQLLRHLSAGARTVKALPYIFGAAEA